ncbi:MAG: B12-binding domain-containing radical SAM protein [Flavobacteriales bacterium]|nr:B12-binding domain-containing radical SAM protein [Flavobacteriales bacterium]
MKVLLTHGYFLQEDEREQQIMKPYPPLGILYISSYLEEQEIEHEVFDTTFSSETEWWTYVEEKKPGVIAFYVNLMTKVKIIHLIRKIRSSEGLASTKIVLGGPDITYNEENYLEAGADFLVIGEGEETFTELVQCLKSNDSLEDVNGLTYRQQGEIKRNKPRIRVKEVDFLPLPNRSRFPIEKYLATWKKAHGKSALNVSTQRGCPYTCKWCSTAVYGQSYRRRSPEKVVEELKTLMETYQPDTFWFVDDVFTVSHKWMRGFAEAMKAADLKVQYECITRAERMNEEIIQILKETGCFRVWIGAESGSQKIIDAMDRRVDIDVVRDQLIATRKAGIETGTFIMVGYPGETYDDILKTATYLESALPDQFTITKSYPIKGTSLYDEVESEITKQPDWFSSTDREIDFKREYPDHFYEAAIRYIHNRVKLKRNEIGTIDRMKTKLKVAISHNTMKRIAKSVGK